MPIPVVLLAAYGWGYREGLAPRSSPGRRSRWPTSSPACRPDALRTGLLASVVVLARRARRRLHAPALARGRASASRRPPTRSARMSLANDLLHALHDVVQTLPSSLDLSEVVASARDTFRELFDSTCSWCSSPTTRRASGTSSSPRARRRRAPRHRRAAHDGAGGARPPGRGAGAEHRDPDRLWNGGVREQRHDRAACARTTVSSGSSRSSTGRRTRTPRKTRAYRRTRVVPRARGRQRPLVLAGCARSGAEAERARIARDLHDNVAQSLAYVGLRARPPRSSRCSDPELPELHGVVRGRRRRAARDALPAPRDGQEEPGSRRRRPRRTSSAGPTAPASTPSSTPHVPAAPGPASRWSRSSGASSRNRSRTSSGMPMPLSMVSWRIGDGTSAARGSRRRTRHERRRGPP